MTGDIANITLVGSAVLKWPIMFPIMLSLTHSLTGSTLRTVVVEPHIENLW